MGRYYRDTIEAPPETRAMTLRWPAPLHDQLRQTAEQHERSLAAEIRIAVREHLDREACEAGRR